MPASVPLDVPANVAPFEFHRWNFLPPYQARPRVRDRYPNGPRRRQRRRLGEPIRLEPGPLRGRTFPTALPLSNDRVRIRKVQMRVGNRMHFYPSIKRPDGHFRHVGSTLVLATLSALLISLLASHLPPTFWRFGMAPDRLLRGIETAANPVLWISLISNVALLAMVAVWMKPLHAWIVRDASRMEITGAAVLGTMLGFAIAQGNWGLDSILKTAVTNIGVYVVMSLALRRFGPEDALDGGKAMKALQSLFALAIFVLCQWTLATLPLAPGP